MRQFIFPSLTSIFILTAFSIFTSLVFAQASQEENFGYAVTVEVIRYGPTTTTTSATSSSTTTTTSPPTATTTTQTTETVATTITTSETTTTTVTETGFGGLGDLTFVFGIVGAVVVGVAVYFMWSRGWHL